MVSRIFASWNHITGWPLEALNENVVDQSWCHAPQRPLDRRDDGRGAGPEPGTILGGSTPSVSGRALPD